MINTPLGLRVVVGPEAALLKNAFAELLGPIIQIPDEEQETAIGVPAFAGLTPTQKLLVLHNLADAMFVSTTPVPDRSAIFDAAVGALFETLSLLVRWEITLQAGGPEPDVVSTRLQILEAFYHLQRLQVEANRQPTERDSEDEPHPAIPDWVLDEASPDPSLELDDETRQAREKLNDLFALPELTALPASDSPSDQPQWSEDDLPEPDSTDESGWNFVLECLCDGILFDRDFELSNQVLDRDPDSTDGITKMLGISDSYFSTAAPDILTSQQQEQIEQQLEVLLAPWFSRQSPV